MPLALLHPPWLPVADTRRRRGFRDEHLSRQRHRDEWHPMTASQGPPGDHKAEMKLKCPDTRTPFLTKETPFPTGCLPGSRGVITRPIENGIVRSWFGPIGVQGIRRIGRYGNSVGEAGFAKRSGIVGGR